jgi:hypothetical protein
MQDHRVPNRNALSAGRIFVAGPDGVIESVPVPVWLLKARAIAALATARTAREIGR